MRRKIVALFAAIALFIGIALDFGMSTNLSTNNFSGAKKKLSRVLPVLESKQDGYRLTFDLDKTASSVINCYMIKYRPDNLEMAWNYARLFIDPAELTEDEDTFIFEGKFGTVTMDQEINHIHYSALAPSDAAADEISSDEEAIDRAFSFISNHFLALYYEESQVSFDGNVYSVKFISRLSNIKNYAFTNQVRLSRFGHILDADYYNIQYDRVGGCRIRSMAEAFTELPPPPENETVLLERAQLVYIYEDSILQPAYYFQGSATNDQSYECFVRAAVF